MNRFFSLTPDLILDAVESALDSQRTGNRATGRAQALNSIENRVIEIDFEDGSAVIAKFYRPGRWSAAQIVEEHQVLADLQSHELPVVPPLTLREGPHSKLLGPHLACTPDDILFTLFPKVRGRSKDELGEDELTVLGRLLGRMHAVMAVRGQRGARSSRITLDVNSYGYDSLRILVDTGFLEGPLKSRYLGYADDLCARAEMLMAQVPTQLVHGDCHLGNLLWNETGPFFVDFDDMVIAPPVQDIWMIAGGRDDYGRRQRETLLDAYEEMNSFNFVSLQLIEVLRSLRLIHYSAWIAQRWDDPSFPRMFPHFGGEKYWQEEIEALSEISALVENQSVHD